MAELLPSAPPLVTAQAPVSGVSPAEAAQPYSELASTLSKTGEAAETAAETLATRAGYEAAKPGPDGIPEIQKSLYVGTASQAYAKAMKFAALSEGEGLAKDKAREFMTQYADDPQGFLHASEGYRQRTIEQLTQAGAPEVGLALGRAIASSSMFTYRMLLDRKMNTDLRNASITIGTGRTAAINDLRALARGGDTSSPQFQQAWDKYKTLTQQAVDNPLLHYPAEKAAFDTEQLHGELYGDTFLHHIDQVYRDTGVNSDGSPRGGPAAALAAANTILTDPAAKLSPAQREQFHAKAVAEIRANEAVRRQSVQDARGAEASLDQQSALGMRIDPQQVDEIADAYTRAGAPADAARFLAKMARRPLNDDFGRQPLGQQVEQLGALLNGANPTSAAEARLINHESGGNPRRVNGFGYAGLYQFGAPLLADLGLYKPGAGESLADWSRTPANAAGKWSGTFDIPGFPQVKTLADFLANPAAQKAAFDIHSANMDAAIKANGLDKYIGSTVGGVPITRDGLHAMIHLGGVANTMRTLQSGGSYNPADANGTTLLHYAAIGAQGAHATPSASLWLAANRARVLDKGANAQWQKIMEAYGKTGVRPANATINQIIQAARLSNDSALLDTIATGVDRMDAGARFAQESLPEQSSAMGTMQQAAATGLLTPAQSAVLKDLQAKHQAIVAGLSQNPIRTAAANFPTRLSMPGPLDLNDPQAFAAGLAQRASIAQFARQNWQTGPLSALDAADLAQIKGALDTTDPTKKAAIFQGLATLPPDVLGATLRKLGGDSPATMAEAAAGSLMRTAPDIGLSIFRGQAAMKADPKWNPESGPLGKSAFHAELAAQLPPTVFPLRMRTDPTGPYATMTAMVRARYADLSAQAGDTGYSKARLDQAVQDVTGGLVTFNGREVLAPRRGMKQGDFDAVMSGLTDRDLDGVTTLNGAPITAAYLRAKAHLESIGDGRYQVTFGSDEEHPIYAYRYANTERPSRFVLDLSGRQPGPQQPTAAPTVP